MFSSTNGWLSACVSFEDTSRAVVSVCPPGPLAMMTRTGFAG